MKRVELFALLRKQAERLAADIPEIAVILLCGLVLVLYARRTIEARA